MRAVAEERQSLWMLTFSPVIWSAHFMACYITAALWCGMIAGPRGSLWTARVAIFAYTALALIGIAAIGYIGYRRHSYGNATLPHDADSPEDRHRFLGFATLLLSGLSAVGVIYAAMAAVFIQTCE